MTASTIIMITVIAAGLNAGLFLAGRMMTPEGPVDENGICAAAKKEWRSLRREIDNERILFG